MHLPDTVECDDILPGNGRGNDAPGGFYETAEDWKDAIFNNPNGIPGAVVWLLGGAGGPNGLNAGRGPGVVFEEILAAQLRCELQRDL